MLSLSPPGLLCRGRYEILKAGVHGAASGLAAVCAVYNAAAWVARRQRHSWVNAVLYGTLVVWELQHVRHHIDCHHGSVARGGTDGQQAA
jgi:hypothetical protein